MKHEHAESIKAKAEMIKAKADNMDLVLLSNGGKGWKFSVSDFPWIGNVDYFLCHQKHAIAVLHVLNGGSIELKGEYHEREVKAGEIGTWSKGMWYMREDMESRIKPKRERRWIVVGTCPLEANESDWCLAFADHNEAEKFCEEADMSGFKSKVIGIEIEIEVN